MGALFFFALLVGGLRSDGQGHLASRPPHRPREPACADGEEGLEKAKELLPDLIVMDIYMWGLDGLEATRQIKAEVPRVKLVILTVFEEDHRPAEAHRPGVLISLSGRQVLKEVVFGAPGRAPGEALLTARERAVLELVAQSRTNKEIALALDLSKHTVKRHLEHILKRLHLRSHLGLRHQRFCPSKPIGKRDRTRTSQAASGGF